MAFSSQKIQIQTRHCAWCGTEASFESSAAAKKRKLSSAISFLHRRSRRRHGRHVSYAGLGSGLQVFDRVLVGRLARPKGWSFEYMGQLGEPGSPLLPSILMTSSLFIPRGMKFCEELRTIVLFKYCFDFTFTEFHKVIGYPSF